MAARLSEDATLHVERIKGALGELRVVVDDVDVVETSLISYPAPTSVVDKVRAYLGPRVAS